jgi:hypothetical protein
LFAALVESPNCKVRRLAQGNRAQQMKFSRFLHNQAVTVEEMAEFARERTVHRVGGRDVLVVHDSSEIVFCGTDGAERGFGLVGRHGNTGGVLLHAALAVEVEGDGVLGLADLQIFNRPQGKRVSHRKRATKEKESCRWINTMMAVSERFCEASSITLIADRESDIYEEFARRPSNVQLITRAAQNRRVVHSEAGTLEELVRSLHVRERFTLKVPSAPGRAARDAALLMRFSKVNICKPLHGAAPGLPGDIELTVVDIEEEKKPGNTHALHWRLLTTHHVGTLRDAHRITDFYKRRWTIEEYFRTLKTAAFDIEDCALEDAAATIRLTAAAACAAVTVMQLVRARDGTTGESIEDALEHEDIPVLEAVCATLEGKTARQKNPHPKGSLAYASWVIARLGAWDGYYGKPGPKVMRIGLQKYQNIKIGYAMRQKNV